MTRRNHAGFSVAEVLVTMGLFSVMGLIGLMLLVQATSTDRRLDGNEMALLQLKKAARYLDNDANQASYNSSNSTVVPPSLAGGANDGDALWFLSAANSATGETVENVTGEPIWQRNILYYLIVPQGDTCQGGAGPQGLDDRCPHKVLVRKVINLTVQPQPLLGSLAPYFTRPLGATCEAMSAEPNLESAAVIATNLLSFEVDRDSDIVCEIRITMRAVPLEEDGRLLHIGVDALSSESHTQAFQVSLFPRN